MQERGKLEEKIFGPFYRTLKAILFNGTAFALGNSNYISFAGSIGYFCYIEQHGKIL